MASAARTRVRRRRLRSPALLLGSGLTLVLVAVALFVEVLAPGSPFASVGRPFEPPSGSFPFGTDDLGRSVLQGVVHGARTSLLVGFSVAGASFFIGVLIGGVSGFLGGWVDDVLMRLTELVLILPRFFLALVVVALLGAGLPNLIVVLALTSWGFIARVTRAGVLGTRELDFVLAARGLGRTEFSNLVRHVLPNVMAPVIAYGALVVGNAILIEAGLSFLGLGDPNVVSWGYMLNSAQGFVRRAWWMSAFPGLAIAATVLGVNLLGDGLNGLWNRRGAPFREPG